MFLCRNAKNSVSVNSMRDPVRVLVLNDDKNFIKRLEKFFENDEVINICVCSERELNVDKYLEFYSPDVIVVDSCIKDFEGVQILEKLKKIYNRTFKIIVISNFDNIFILKKNFSYEVDYYVENPVILSLLKKAIISVCRKNFNCNQITQGQIKSFLRSLGIPTSVLGYTYIYQAIEYMISEANGVCASEIYRFISDKALTSPQAVEAAIRNTIKRKEVINNKYFIEIFGCGIKPPSNLKFLSLVKELICEKYFFS